VVRQFGWVMPDLEMGRIADLHQNTPLRLSGDHTLAATWTSKARSKTVKL
jgi:hypothetical protein